MWSILVWILFKKTSRGTLHWGFIHQVSSSSGALKNPGSIRFKVRGVRNIAIRSLSVNPYVVAVRYLESNLASAKFATLPREVPRKVCINLR